MKINKIKLENFKFHKNLEFEIKSQNCLIYGENGTGKSSIYFALYSIFKVYFRNDLYDFTKFKCRSSENGILIDIELDNTHLIIPFANYALPATISINDRSTIYFANQELFESITTYNENFYLTLKNILKKYFKKLNDYCESFDNINNQINDVNYSFLNDTRKETISKFEIFLIELADFTNLIISQDFNETFIINFKYTWGTSDTLSDYKFSTPEIIIQIDDMDNLRNNFNEAKLKLVSVAIYFSLILMHEEDNSIKLLVLDDFLTSLDMSNRKYIIEYILKNFSGYQKIILSHNLQFYNLITRMINDRNEYDNWDIKNIFLRNINNYDESFMVSQKIDYLAKAKINLQQGQYQISGNLLRKEFEKIINKFEQLLEIGKKEELQAILDVMKSSDDNKFYTKPFLYLKKFKLLLCYIEDILKSGDTPSVKISKLTHTVNTFKTTKLIEHEYELHDLKNVIKKVDFYKNVLFNPLSHNDNEKEIYKKELEDSIKLLTNMNTILNTIS